MGFGEVPLPILRRNASPITKCDATAVRLLYLGIVAFATA